MNRAIAQIKRLIAETEAKIEHATAAHSSMKKETDAKAEEIAEHKALVEELRAAFKSIPPTTVRMIGAEDARPKKRA